MIYNIIEFDGSIPAQCNLHVELSFGEILNPKIASDVPSGGNVCECLKLLVKADGLCRLAHECSTVCKVL